MDDNIIYMSTTVAAATVMGAIAIYAFVNRRVRGARYFACIMLCRSLFACASIFENASSRLPVKLFFRNIEQSMLVLIVPLVLFFVLDYIGKDRLLKPVRMVPILLLFVLFALLLWTDGLHHLMRDEISLYDGQLVIVRSLYNIAFNLFGIMIILASLVFLAVHIVKTRPEYRMRAIWIWIYILVPATIEMLKIINPHVLQLHMLRSVVTGLLGVITFWVIFRYRLFSIVPVARDKVMEVIQECVLIVDGNGTVIDSNEFATRLLDRGGRSKHGVLERNVKELLVSWPEWQSACNRMERAEMEIEVGLGVERKMYYVNVYPLESEGKKQQGTVSILFDMTENRKRYEQLAEMNRMKEQLITVVSHDIRDPLAALINLTELLEEEKSAFSDESAEVVDAVREQVKSTYAMVDNMLQWFRSQKSGLTLHPLMWGLDGIIRESVEVLQLKSDAKRIVVTCGSIDRMRVYADREVIGLVVRNLLSNAIKFTEPGGQVRIDAEPSDGQIVVSISDSGVGMEPDKVKLLFEHTALASTVGTAGERGTGMGLLVSKEYARLSGGDIRLESTPGQGSVFYLTLPGLRL